MAPPLGELSAKLTERATGAGYPLRRLIAASSPIVRANFVSFADSAPFGSAKSAGTIPGMIVLRKRRDTRPRVSAGTMPGMRKSDTPGGVSLRPAGNAGGG